MLNCIGSVNNSLVVHDPEGPDAQLGIEQTWCILEVDGFSLIDL